MIYIMLNLVPILLATASGLLFGAVYHLLTGDGAASRRGGGALLFTAAVAEFWLAAILAGALILAPSKAGAWTMALGSPLVIWLGFVVPTLIVTHRFRQLSWRLALIDCGHWLGVMLVQAVVLHSHGLTPPPV